MNRGNMGKQISNAPKSKSKSKKVKKMAFGGMASMPPLNMFGGGDKSMPGKPGFGRVATPPPSPGGAFTSMPSKPMPGKPSPLDGPGVSRTMPAPMPGKPSPLDGPGVSRTMPAPMPGPTFRTQGPSSMPGGVRGISVPNPAPMGMAKGGAVKKMAKGGKANKIDGCCIKGHTKGTMK